MPDQTKKSSPEEVAALQSLAEMLAALPENAAVCVLPSPDENIAVPLDRLQSLARKYLSQFSGGRKRKFASDRERYAFHNAKRKKKTAK